MVMVPAVIELMIRVYALVQVKTDSMECIMETGLAGPVGLLPGPTAVELSRENLPRNIIHASTVIFTKKYWRKRDQNSR